MDYKVLYRKYRPQNFADLVGQDHIKDILLKSIISNKLSHAYLFTGPRGTGKTSTAKLFAKVINCENSTSGVPCNKCLSCLNYNESTDIIEIDAASNNGVDEIRELRDNIKLLPSLSKYKVYIIDEIHMLSSSAWNAFLKTLEEPPNHVVFVLATTEIQKVPITVLSRCQRYDFQRISSQILAEQIVKIAKAEKIKITSDAVEEITRLADGSMRDALSILDQLSQLEMKIDIDTIASAYGILTLQDVDLLLRSVNNGNVSEMIELINRIQENGIDSNLLLNKVLERLLQSLINYKTTGNSEYPLLVNIGEIIFELEKCYNRNNPYILIKSTLLKHTTGKQPLGNIESVMEKEIIQEAKTAEIISREIILPTELPIISQDLIDIRVNNAYVDANITLKREFIKIWADFIDVLSKQNELKYLSLLENCAVEVVSPTNVIVSTEYYTNSVLFNELASEIESKLKDKMQIEKKVVCLDSPGWIKAKSDYIKNKKTKEYIYITEPEITKVCETVNSAESLFGNELIEIN